jgi:hypothetical protein
VDEQYIFAVRFRDTVIENHQLFKKSNPNLQVGEQQTLFAMEVRITTIKPLLMDTSLSNRI